MSTGNKVIKGALKKIGAHSAVSPAEPEEIVEAMETLNSMLQLWRSQGILNQLMPLKVPGDELAEPSDSRNIIEDNLAIACAPNFDNGKVIVSATLERNARVGYAWLKNLNQVISIPDKIPSSMLPRGAGNSKGTYRKTFFGKDGKLDG
jgi:hypothetical protein